MLHVKGIRGNNKEKKGKKTNRKYECKCIQIKIRTYSRHIAVLVSITGHMVVAGIYDHLLLPPTLFPLPSASTSSNHGSLSGGVIQTFIPEGSGPVLDWVFIVFH